MRSLEAVLASSLVFAAALFVGFNLWSVFAVFSLGMHDDKFGSAWNNYALDLAGSVAITAATLPGYASALALVRKKGRFSAIDAVAALIAGLLATVVIASGGWTWVVGWVLSGSERSPAFLGKKVVAARVLAGLFALGFIVGLGSLAHRFNAASDTAR